MKRRSSIVRHVSRTHFVDRKRLFVRIKLDSSIPIRHVRTAEQLADILTDGALTAIQWKSLMRLFDIHLPLQVEC